VTYNLISVAYHALQGAENYTVYASDAGIRRPGSFAQFFRQLVDEERRRADMVKSHLRRRLVNTI
jgi:hypothetical protein